MSWALPMPSLPSTELSLAPEPAQLGKCPSTSPGGTGLGFGGSLRRLGRAGCRLREGLGTAQPLLPAAALLHSLGGDGDWDGMALALASHGFGIG